MTAKILHGSNLDVLPTIADASVDAIVTDPPYELGFMGKKWDASGIAYNVELWRECLRVLKPGGHLLAFGGTRTYHRMAVAIEDAGFEIRDSIHWLYGSGFPKSLDVSKAIDKVNGEPDRLLRFTRWMRTTGLTARQLDEITGTNMGGHYITAKSQPAIPTAAIWSVIRPHVTDVPEWVDELVERIEAEREVVGKRDVPVGHAFAGETYGGDSSNHTVAVTAPATDAAKQWEGWGTALKPAHEPIVVARKPLDGTVAANVLQHGTGALNIDGCRVGSDGGTREIPDGSSGKGGTTVQAGGRWPANVIIDDTITGDWARYFYCAKPSKGERNAGLHGLPERHKSQLGGEKQSREGLDPVSARFVSADPVANIHPTVKPIALMRWLVRLVTPPDGTILDPFAGSGTTLAAATLEGVNSIGIELTDEYLPIIEGRIQWAEQQHDQTALFD